MTSIKILPEGQFSSLNDITVPNLISAAVIFSLIIASLSFFFALLSGGIKYMMSSGKKEKTKEASDQLINALIGLLIVFSAWAIMNLISVFFGVDLFNFNIPNVKFN